MTAADSPQLKKLAPVAGPQQHIQTASCRPAVVFRSERLPQNRLQTVNTTGKGSVIRVPGPAARDPKPKYFEKY
jgi:hypothetical protein